MKEKQQPKGKLITQSIRTGAEEFEHKEDRADLRVQYPNATIRSFRRTVRADGLNFPVYIVVVRERITR